MTKGHLHYPFHEPPPLGGAIEVTPGIKWLRVPLPFKLNHINLWLVEDGAGWTLIDTGMNNHTTREMWGGPLLEHLDGKPVVRILCTHMHPDHMGLAGYLAPLFGVEVWASLSDWTYGRMLALDGGEAFMDVHVDFFHRAGLTGPDMDLVYERGNSYAKRAMAPPPSFHRLIGGHRLAIGGQNWRLIEGNGHSPEHISLYNPERNILISGDQVLPKISPIVSVWPQEPKADPLTQFMASLDSFADIPDDVFVLPSHGLPFKGLKTRLAQLRTHHDQRLDDTRTATQTPATVMEVLRVLFPKASDPNDVLFACTETIAHLHRLMTLGEIKWEAGPDGLDRYLKT